RMSLGADSARVQRMILGEGGVLLAAGLALGVAGGFAAAGVMRGLLFGVAPPSWRSSASSHAGFRRCAPPASIPRSRCGQPSGCARFPVASERLDRGLCQCHLLGLLLVQRERLELESVQDADAELHVALANHELRAVA